MHTLDDLERGALDGARHVRLVGLGLRHFPTALYRLADTLEVLDLSANALDSLPADLHRFGQLRILFASNNPFTTLPQALGRCAQLEMVGFKACAIEDVPADSLPPRLRWLILTDNRIVRMPAELGQRPRLQKLMLSCNRLDSLPDLRDCQALELLRIAGNRFQAIPQTLLELPALAWPALAGNPLSTSAEQTALQAAQAQALAYHTLAIGPLLGEGASGHIHRATDTGSGQAFALKLFKAAATSDGTPQSELAAGLVAGRHPCLLTPLAPVQGHPEGKLATALPLLPARFLPLAAPPDFASCTRDIYADDLQLAPALAQRLLACIHAAVTHLHGRGVLHGDLYAHNILWDPATGQALLSDFGAALLTNGMPAAQVAQLQAIEWRAFGHLQNEILARVQQPPMPG